MEKTVKARYNAYRLTRLAMEQVDRKTNRRIYGGYFLFRPNLREAIRGMLGLTNATKTDRSYVPVYSSFAGTSTPREVRFNLRGGVSIGCQEFGNREARVLFDWAQMYGYKFRLKKPR